MNGMPKLFAFSYSYPLVIFPISQSVIIIALLHHTKTENAVKISEFVIVITKTQVQKRAPTNQHTTRKPLLPQNRKTIEYEPLS